jgi:hypothetical protein
LGAFVSTAAFAQVRFAPKIGINLASGSVSDDTTGMPVPANRIGYHIGAVADIHVYKMVSLQSGILFSNKGYKVSNDFLDLNVSSNYLEVPISFVANFPLKKDIKLIVQAGSYFSYCLGGTTTTKALGKETTDDLRVGTGADKTIKPSDIGVSGGVGIEYKKAQVLFSYAKGMSNLNPSQTSTVLKNQNFMISLAYYFGGDE